VKLETFIRLITDYFKHKILLPVHKISIAEDLPEITRITVLLPKSVAIIILNHKYLYFNE